MSDDLIKNLRSVNGTEAPYANDTVRAWCHQAADTIERLTAENNRNAAIAFVAMKKVELTQKERDEARAALREAASLPGWWLGVDGHGEPDGTYCSVKPSDDPNARLYVSADAILALIDKMAPANG